MTLTDIMPTLRMSIPDPIDVVAWPPHTSVTTDDVLVENLSMRGVSGLLDTPCEWSTEHASVSGCRTVVMCRVSAVVHDGADDPILLVDCDVARLAASWSHARLIDRISVAYKGSFRLLGDGSRSEHIMAREVSGAPESSASVSLPRDLVVGDLLIVPCLPTPATSRTAAPAELSRIPQTAAPV